MLAEPSSVFLMPQAGALCIPVTYVDDRERARHLHVIELLAKELARSVAEIKPLYEDILIHMQEVARIRDYLPILVCKRMKSSFKR